MSVFRARIKLVSAVGGLAAVVAMAAIGSVGTSQVAAWVGSPPAPMTVGRSATATAAVTTVMPAKAAPEVKAPHR